MQTCEITVFSDDWGRHPSSCQHLVRRFLPTHRVRWVNTIGMRCPRFDRATIQRAGEKLLHWFGQRQGRDAGDSNPAVVNPKMWPWFSTRFDRWLNRKLLLRQLSPLFADASSPRVVITTLPIVADLMDRLPASRWVYYCVDDFSKWPGMDGNAITQMEERVTRRADVVIAVSEKLQDRLAGWGRDAHLLTHGVDLEHWQKPPAATGAACLAGLERPLILFWGFIDWRLDRALVRRLAGELDRGTIVLVGPRSEADDEVFRVPRVAWVPPVPYEYLPAIAREASVLIMPYIDAPGMRELQPLKLKEYLATGKPVVVSDLPANRAWADAMDLASTASDFCDAVRARLAGVLPESQAAARQCLQHESWAEKARQFEHWAFAGLGSGEEFRR
jgi:glycosyltransferase involved in cell wall biosynthesis